MTIRFACPNGHLLKADDRHVGRSARCPRCRASVRVPRPRRAEAVTDTQVMRLVGSYTPRSSVIAGRPPAAEQPERNCPRCRNVVSAAYRICPHCQVYLGGPE